MGVTVRLKVFEVHMEAVELLNKRLIEVENALKFCRETLSVSKDDETSKVAATEET